MVNLKRLLAANLVSMIGTGNFIWIFNDFRDDSA